MWPASYFSILMFLQKAPDRTCRAESVCSIAPVRSGQVVIARGDQDLHVRILGQCVLQLIGCGGITHLLLPIPRANSFAQDEIGDIGLVAQLGADVIVERGRVETRTPARLGSKLGLAAGGELSIP